MNYFIKDGIAQAGPFTMTDIVRKIRNGSLTADMFVVGEQEEEPVAANEHPDLKSFFREIDAESAREGFSRGERNVRFMDSLMRGWRFLTAHHETVILGAAALGFVLVVTAIAYYLFPGFLGALTPVMVGIAGMFAISVLLLAFSRLTRGQNVSPETLLGILRQNMQPLLFFSVMAGIFASLGIFIIIVPGLLAIAFYSFTPLLIIDRKMDFWDAMELSRKTILAAGRPMLEVTLGFAAINLLAGIFVLPLLITLPMTYGALAEIFDETDFSDGE